jgi:hypothetical protein
MRRRADIADGRYGSTEDDGGLSRREEEPDDDDDEAPETPLDEPAPTPVQDPPDEPDKGPYTSKCYRPFKSNPWRAKDHVLEGANTCRPLQRNVKERRCRLTRRHRTHDEGVERHMTARRR